MPVHPRALAQKPGAQPRNQLLQTPSHSHPNIHTDHAFVLCYAVLRRVMVQPRKQQSLEYCTDIMVNFGHWPLSTFTCHACPFPTCELCTQNNSRANKLPAPWTAEKYRKKLESAAAKMKFWMERGQRVVWVNSMAHPGSPMSDPYVNGWQTDPYLELYNRLAEDVMSKAGIPFIDTFSLTNPLSDLTDTMHYPHTGLVGQAVNRLLLSTLCQP